MEDDVDARQRRAERAGLEVVPERKRGGRE